MIRKLFRYLLILLLVNCAFLFAPPHPCKEFGSLCSHNYIRLNRVMEFRLIPDGTQFILCAMEPERILEPGHPRQSRPLYVLLGTAAGYGLWWASAPFHESLTERIEASRASTRIQETSIRLAMSVAFLAGFVIINIVICLLAMFFFEEDLRLIAGEWKHPRLLLDTLLMLLVGGELNKSFFWVPHQQMFALLTPLMNVWLAIRISSGRMSVAGIRWLSLLCGVLLLVYGNFLLTLPCILASMMVSPERVGMNRVTTAKRLLFVLLLFALPTITWIVILECLGIRFHSEEVSKYRQFIWIADALSIGMGEFFSRLSLNTGYYLRTFGSSLPVIGLWILTGVWTIRLSLRDFTSESHQGSTLRASFANSRIVWMWVAGTTGFYWLLGFYSDRLTYTIAPLLLLLVGIMLNRLPLQRWQQWMIMVYVLCCIAWVCLFGAPHLSADYTQ